MRLSVAFIYAVVLSAIFGCVGTQPLYRQRVREMSPRFAKTMEELTTPAIGFMTSKAGVVCTLSPNASEQGIRAGDRVLEWYGLQFDSDLGWERVVEARNRLIAEEKPLTLRLQRNGETIEVSAKASANRWATEWYAKVRQSDWTGALAILDAAATRHDTSMSEFVYLDVRLQLENLRELASFGQVGWGSLYAWTKLSNQSFKWAEFNSELIELNRQMILGNIEFARELRASAIAQDLSSRLAEWDRAASKRPETGTRERQASTAAGTGFFISSTGVVLTAHHLVDGATELFVVLGSGEKVSARLLKAQPTLDLAILQTSLTPTDFLSVPQTMDCRLGDPVFTIGFPVTDVLGSEPKFTDGAISSLSGVGDDSSFLQISVPIQPGNSGGPLVNNQGEAIGVVVSSAAPAAFLRAAGTLPQNVNFAVRSDLARPLLAEFLITPPAGCESRAAAIDRAKRSVVLVIAEVR